MLFPEGLELVRIRSTTHQNHEETKFTVLLNTSQDNTEAFRDDNIFFSFLYIGLCLLME
jgi:hypothetical protein